MVVLFGLWPSVLGSVLLVVVGVGFVSVVSGILARFLLISMKCSSPAFSRKK